LRPACYLTSLLGELSGEPRFADDLKLDSRERAESAQATIKQMNTKLYVGNIPFSTTAQDLQDLFAQAGTVASVDLIFDKLTGRSRGFAFVGMTTGEEAQQAIEKLNGYSMDGRNLTVTEARPKEDRPARSFEGGERRGFGGGGRSSGGHHGHRGERGERSERGSGWERRG
jgi:cold-inducible RNA-binding protein